MGLLARFAHSSPIKTNSIRSPPPRFVVLFPALDVASAFPLNGITLGNNLMSSWHGENTRIAEGDRRKVTAFRIIAAVPPIVGACFVRELSKITDYTGMLG